MASTAIRRTPPTTPIVSAFESASDRLTSLRPKAVPAALRIASRITATPIATSQPKNAAPQLRPPYSARCRARTSRAASRPVRPVLAVSSRTKRPSPVSGSVVVAGRSAVATVPRSSYRSAVPPFLLKRSNMSSWYPRWYPRKPLWSGRRGALPAAWRGDEGRLSTPQARPLLPVPEQGRSLEAGRLGVLARARRAALLAAVRLAVEALDHAERD